VLDDESLARFTYRATEMIGPSGLSSKSRMYTGLALAGAFDALVASLHCSGVRRFAGAFPPFLPGKLFSPVCSVVGVITFLHCKCLSVPLMISTQPGNSFCSTVWAKTVGVNTRTMRRATVSHFMTQPARVPVYAQEARI